ARLADDTDGLALGDGDVDVLDRAHDAPAGRELDREIPDIEERKRGHAKAAMSPRVSRMRCSAKRCTADPGPPQAPSLGRSRVCSASLRAALRPGHRWCFVG